MSKEAKPERRKRKMGKLEEEKRKMDLAKHPIDMSKKKQL